MATAEEIAQNIAASQARKAAARERQKKVEKEPPSQARHPHADWEGKLVGFIVRTRKDMFKPIVARVSLFMDEHDGFLAPIADQPKTDTLEAARACFEGEARDGIDHVFLNPIPSDNGMGSWLSQLLRVDNIH